MPQSLANILVHLIFSTKERRPLIRDGIRERLHAYIVGVLENQQSPSLRTNSVEDHIHILFVLSKNMALAKVVQEVKQSSSKWVKEQDDDYRSFAWQNGYAAFSVSESQRVAVGDYIEKQPQHHAKVSFQDELRQFFGKHGVKYDEQYV
jgi:putative transposase